MVACGGGAGQVSRVPGSLPFQRAQLYGIPAARGRSRTTARVALARIDVDSQQYHMNYNAMELMICCAARLLEDGRTVAVGTGVPCATAMLAQRTGAPHLGIVFE